MASASTAVLRLKGVKSIEFALSFAIAVVVMYDAMSIRRNAGFHAAEINNINKIINNEGGAKLRELLGHKPIEVFFGAVLGTIIALVVPMKL